MKLQRLFSSQETPVLSVGVNGYEAFSLFLLPLVLAASHVVW